LLTCLARVFSDENQPAVKKLCVNGYSFDGPITPDQIMGLRLKARADLFYREKEFANAVKFYEEASQFLPDEADIYFNLGNIYSGRGIDNLAADYFKRAGEKYLFPENHQSRENYYLSLIRYGISLARMSRTGVNEDDSKLAKDVYWKVSDMLPVMTNKFPATMKELSNLNRLIYGDVMINKR
jgi:tetratricopeptide (TPR) repeat protein